MSGLEVLALLAAIVSAFTGGSELFMKWRARRRERKALKQNDAVGTILRRGAPEVKAEYDRDFARLGRVFARGDGMHTNDLSRSNANIYS